ncbi:MAG TPA: lipoate--protein ligase [Tenuifilum sp.]|uniref:lipoate--protein ligase family protein n=3 Tax=Tenuifilum sp. TaxID=2760880 RepID=UPI002B6864E3|nr:lipoate--protein ligase [Tenuifilum sp.]HOK86890.1 lipoate--protein ligase [Tenuifilum sp.]HON69778.1 lipoate--protein ligase [Tenuifilum sp.]HOU74085.1 lipoate--protein ligase [Tenuifilum sp.]HQI89180.1 lipoate--protein ligase [Tenuifilum sp.]
MRIILQPTHDPYFNIATEEYLLKHSNDDYIILYRNTPSVIVGKHQNTMAELNHSFINSSKIPVIRRLSGGGTVFHDLGNVNFCFMVNGREGNLVDFKRFTTPIIEFLKELGLNAYRGEKNDIRIGNYKVSGNAERVHKNRVMHHGTLLYSTNMFWLEQAIKSNENSYTDRAIRSNRSRTINIAELLPHPMTIETFEIALSEFLTKYHSATPLQLDDSAKRTINTLATTKYTDWNWNYGYNASYDFRVKIDSNILVLKVTSGIIEKVEIIQNCSSWIHKLAKLLEGKRHDYAYLKNELGNTEYSEKIQEIIENLF